MRRLHPKVDSLLELLMFLQGLAMRTIDARVGGQGSRAAPVTKAGTRVKSVNERICLNEDARKQWNV